MLRYTVTTYTNTVELLKTMRSLGYGEIYGVEIVFTGPAVEVEVSKNERDLVDYLDGTPKIDVLTVHQGEPVLAETNCVDNGFRCRKKVKFPTV